jgi:hypothetical protein
MEQCRWGRLSTNRRSNHSRSPVHRYSIYQGVLVTAAAWQLLCSPESQLEKWSGSQGVWAVKLCGNPYSRCQGLYVHENVTTHSNVMISGDACNCVGRPSYWFELWVSRTCGPHPIGSPTVCQWVPPLFTRLTMGRTAVEPDGAVQCA